jgi:hypothetical protein
LDRPAGHRRKSWRGEHLRKPDGPSAETRRAAVTSHRVTPPGAGYMKFMAAVFTVIIKYSEAYVTRVTAEFKTAAGFSNHRSSTPQHSICILLLFRAQHPALCHGIMWPLCDILMRGS